MSLISKVIPKIGVIALYTLKAQRGCLVLIHQCNAIVTQPGSQFQVLFSFLFTDGFKNVLAGQEYTQILSVLAHHISILRIIGNLQKEHLDATKGYRETAAADRNQGLIDAIEKAKMV